MTWILYLIAIALAVLGVVVIQAEGFGGGILLGVALVLARISGEER